MGRWWKESETVDSPQSRRQASVQARTQGRAGQGRRPRGIGGRSGSLRRGSSKRVEGGDVVGRRGAVSVTRAWWFVFFEAGSTRGVRRKTSGQDAARGSVQMLDAVRSRGGRAR